MSTTVLLTGVTGQVGLSVAPLLQERGHRVLYLIRPIRNKDAVVRLKEVLPNLRETDVVISGDVTLPHAGISEADRRKWRGKIDKIVHGAASVKFDEAAAEETRHINVDGTRIMLNMAEELGVSEFHFISTAYVAGSARAFTETDFDVGQTARNAYESSKREAERLVRNWSGGKFSIYRPSIVIGDSMTGRVRSFNGYYGVAIPFWRLLQNLCQRWETKKKECIRQGIRFSSDDFLELPVCINCSPTSKINLVTSDWVAQTLINLFELSSANQTYHLVNPDPPRVQWVIDTSLEHLGIRGVLHQGNVRFSAYPLLKSIQNGLDRNLNRYLPYVTHEPIFGCENLKRALKERYISPPVVNESLLAKMLDYAKSVNFGQKVRQPIHSGD